MRLISWSASPNPQPTQSNLAQHPDNAYNTKMSEPFNSDNTALLLIDHQVGTMQLIKTIPLEQVRNNTIVLAKIAKILNLPVIMTSSQEEMTQGPLMSELAELLPAAYKNRIQRSGVVNSWEDSAFREAVIATGRKNLIMAGVTTDVCLIFTAISAVQEGFGVQAVLDASGSPFEIAEDMARIRMREAGVVLTATNTLMAELAGNWTRPEGEALKEVLFSEVLPYVR